MNINIRSSDSPVTRLLINRSEEIMEEERVVDKLFFTTSIVSLFLFYIPKHESLTSRSDLEVLIRYRILLTLNLRLYYTNCFIYALEQYEVPSNKIDVIRIYLVSIYVNIKDIEYLSKLLKLGFIYTPR